MQLPTNYRRQKLQQLFENQTTYSLQNVEMNIFETHQRAHEVMLTFDKPVLASMIEGKKVMHLRGKESFVFLPGESVMLPADEPMCIDFPEAKSHTPTKCLALAIDDVKIENAVSLMNDTRPKCDDQLWTRGDFNFHFAHDPVLHQLIQRIIFLCTEDHPAKDFFVGNALDELLIRVVEAESRDYYLNQSNDNSENDRIAFIIDYIRGHLDHKLTIKELSQKAYMSESHFYRSFKNQIGVSPVDFINEERLALAARLLTNPSQALSEVSMRCGFNSMSYFSRRFKRKYSQSPASYQREKQALA